MKEFIKKYWLSAFAFLVGVVLTWFVFSMQKPEIVEVEVIKEIPVEKKVYVEKEVIVSEPKVAEEVVEKEIQTVDYVKKDISNWFDEYDTNKVRANETYTDKIIKVSGEVQSIGEKTFSDGYSVSIVDSGTWSLYSVSCYIDNREVIMELNEGDKITVQGSASEWFLGVSLKDCVVIQ